MGKGTLEARYPLAFVYLRERGVEAPEAFYARLEQLRGSAWTVGKLAAIEQIEQVKASLLDAIKNGQSFEQWQKTLTPEMLALPKHYQETVFRNAVQASYNGAKWAHFRDNAERRPILRYIAVNDSRTRPAHKALHGLMMPIDDPRWQTLAPPGGHNCRCTILNLSEKQAKVLGYQGAPAELPTYKDRHGHDHVCHPDKGWAHSPENSDLTALLREREKKAGLGRAVFDGNKLRGIEIGDGWPPAPITGDIESEARHYVVSNGQRDGVEYAYVVVGNEVIVQRGGTDATVRFTAEELNAINGTQATLYHNHPSGSSLSVEDIRFMADYGLASIIAYGTYNRSEYRASMLKAPNLLKAGLFDIEKQVNKQLADAVRQREISLEDAAHVRIHMINLIMENKGLISYNAVYLDSKTRAIFAEKEQLLNDILEGMK